MVNIHLMVKVPIPTRSRWAVLRRQLGDALGGAKVEGANRWENDGKKQMNDAH